MIVFLSWSGQRANRLAGLLEEWLPHTLQSVRTWKSDTDINKGTGWVQSLFDSLDGAKFSIICVTPENMTKPWLLFELGVSIGKLNQAAPVLLGVKSADVTPPMSLFQVTQLADMEDMTKLLLEINRHSEPPAPEMVVRKALQRCWPEMAVEIAALEAEPSPVPVPAARTEGSKIDELLALVRSLPSATEMPSDSVVPRGLSPRGKANMMGKVLQRRLIDAKLPFEEVNVRDDIVRLNLTDPLMSVQLDQDDSPLNQVLQKTTKQFGAGIMISHPDIPFNDDE